MEIQRKFINQIEGLSPDHVTLLFELYELEKANIAKAIRGCENSVDDSMRGD